MGQALSPEATGVQPDWPRKRLVSSHALGHCPGRWHAGAGLGRTDETTNPESLDDFVSSVVKSAAREMTRAGVLAEPS